ncbi:AraC family transcriptional regulator [Plantactinospora sp. WMMB782]|uniref:AraC family transcriptional regulator n=1 Tax=Plantactinospora sp. WMMB782 TaxID=3404121 RepID=UPI003B932574
MTRLLDRYMIDGLVAEGLVADGSRVRVMRPELRSVPAHWHDYYELGYVLSGTARHVVNGVPRTLRPGGVFLLTPTDFHELHVAGQAPLTCYNVVVEPDVAERWLDRALPTPSGAAGPPWLLDDPSFGPDFDRLWRESAGRLPGAEALADAVLGCILIELARRCADPATSTREPVPGGSDPGGDIRRAVRYVERRFREPLTLAEVAAYVHLSPNYFSERFGQVVGVSFQSYLQTRRLRFARSLLASTGLGVTEICHAAGFNSPSHFGRAYRRRYGQPPSAGRTPEPSASSGPEATGGPGASGLG